MSVIEAISGPVILLCSARSFSSVTNAMLGRHPELFALPEQNLFLIDTLGELMALDENIGPGMGYLTGLKRAVAELEFGEQGESAIKEASVWIQRRWFWRTDRIFRFLEQKVAPSLLVYKSPRTTMGRHSIERMLSAAPMARYIHLVREPSNAVTSWASTVHDKGVHVNRFFAEIWIQCQQTVLNAELSMNVRILRVRGEDVLNHPMESMRKITEWLGISSGENHLRLMQHPEDWIFAQSLPWLRDEDNDVEFLHQPWLRRTPEPRMCLDRLGLDSELTKKMERLGNMLGYSV